MKRRIPTSWSITPRLAVAISLVFALALGLVVLLMLANLRRGFGRAIGHEVHTLVASHAANLDNRIEAARRTIESLGALLPREALRDSEIAQRFLDAQSIAKLTFDLGLSVAGGDELVVAASVDDRATARALRRGPMVARDTTAAARSTGLSQVSRPYRSPSCNGCTTLAIVAPILAENRLVAGFMAGELRLDGINFLAALGDVKVGERGYFYLTTQDRLMIVHPDKERILRPAAGPGQNAFYDLALAGKDGFGTTVTSTGSKVIVAMHHLKSTGWILAANYPQAEAEAPFVSARRTVYVQAAAAGVVVLALVWFVTHWFLRPLSALTEHVTGLASKDERVLSLRASGEVGTLVSAFNRMVEELAIREANEMRRGQIEALRKVSIGVLHQARQPLQVLASNLELLALSTSTNDRARYAAEACAGIDRLTRLFDRLETIQREASWETEAYADSDEMLAVGDQADDEDASHR